MKKKIFLINLLIVTGLIANASLKAAEDPKTLEIGASAPAFSLPGVDGKTYTLDSFKSWQNTGDNLYGKPLSHSTGI